MRVRVKICGITSAADARAAADAGADALGLNFFAGSPRGIPEQAAAQILGELPPFVEAVGLFVNEPWEHVGAVARRLGLRTVQIHADQMTPCPYDDLRWLAAFAVSDRRDLDVVKERLASWARHPARPAAVLLDARAPGLYGGTGRTAPWQLLAGFEPGVPVILAGGLTPDNVAEAAGVVRPYAVDVASGVEASPGKKDEHKMRRFIAAARGEAV